MPSLPVLRRTSTAERWEASYRAELKYRELAGSSTPSSPVEDSKRKRRAGVHPYLAGNFAPVFNEYISYPCDVIAGAIPSVLAGGQYVRNGGNPIFPPEAGRHYHWFDGDGMLHGVLFPAGSTVPLYTNRHLQTPLLSFSLLLLHPPLPSISTLIQPLSSLPLILAALLQGVWLAIRARMGVLSVANTSLFWWATGPETGRLLATCESGPPLQVRIPELETGEWERFVEVGTDSGESLCTNRDQSWARWIRSLGMCGIQEDWMTAHPRVDPIDGSLLFYSSQMFSSPHLVYSVIDRTGKHLVWKQGVQVGRAKMMHDFAATRTMTIVLNLPLTLSPSNLFSLRKPQPLIHFDRSLPSEFIIFPRLLGDPATPQAPVTFTDPESCLIFHTANAWDTQNGDVEMLACRFKSAKLVYAAGAVKVPPVEKEAGKGDVVNLYYYYFALPTGYRTPSATNATPTRGEIVHSFPFSPIPFEFPTYPAHLSMSQTRYIYGCTMRQGSFDERLGGAAKVDCLVKFDVRTLINRGQMRKQNLKAAVDPRSVMEILHDQKHAARQGPIQVFALPEGWYAQEPRFVPKDGDGLDEDDGYLITYVYDESYILPDGAASNAPGTGSEMWIIDAKRMALGMEAVECRIKLPQRVPYGLHGTYIPASDAATQRPMPGLAPQALLQDKLHQSRLAYFCDIVFHRPSVREKSRAERLVLALLWPVAWVALAIAFAEVLRMSGVSRDDMLQGMQTNQTT